MKDIQDIISSYKGMCSKPGSVAVLATIIKTSGSTYRKAGARALIFKDKTIIGLIGGGCLEDDILDEAMDVFHTGHAKLIHYDNSLDGDMVWGLGLGCAGKIDVLLEKIVSDNSELADFISACISVRCKGVIVTVVNLQLDDIVTVSRCMVSEQQGMSGEVELISLYNLNVCVNRALDQNLTSQLIESDNNLILIELLNPPLQLIVFGGGVDVIPMLSLSSQLGWKSVMVDERIHHNQEHRKFCADEVITCSFDKVSEHVLIDDCTAIVIMTHRYKNDQLLLEFSLNTPAFYIAVLGASKRLQNILQAIEKAHHKDFFKTTMLNRVYGPAGLDIGANTPEEIALSLISEIQQVYTKSAGGLLRDKTKPIHNS